MKRKYEIGFIINPESSEEEVKKIIDSVADVIKKTGGTIENIDEWGRKPMAYAMGKHNEGIYTFINAELPGSAFFDIERRLKLSERVMRYMILRLDDKLKKANRLTKKWQKMERLNKKESVEERGEPARKRNPRESEEDEEADNE
jgi:small subunit ribosomal protein S6